MLYIFHTYVVCVLFRCCVWLQWFSMCFRCVFQVFQEHVSTAFRCILQPLYLNVSKVDRVLHLFSHFMLYCLSKHPYKRGMCDEHRTREYIRRVQTRAPYRRTLPLERDGHCHARQRGPRTSQLQEHRRVVTWAHSQT
jgi:hypothetical protein